MNLARSSIRQLISSQKELSLVFQGLIVGVLSGLVGGTFRKLLEFIGVLHNQFYGWVRGHKIMGILMAILVTTLLLFLVLWMVRRFAPEAGGSGIHEIEGALDNKRLMRWKRVIPVKFFGAILSLGSGLVLGREGPTIQLGANLGKMVSSFNKSDERTTNNLVAAGSAAGLAAAFNAPFSAIIFILEEMRAGYKYSFFSFQSVMVAAASSDILVRFMTNQKPIIKMAAFQSPGLDTLWLFLLLGCVFGLLGVVFNQTIYRSLDFFSVLTQKSIWLTASLVSVVLVLVTVYSAELVGGGYDVLFEVLDMHMSLSMVMLLFVGRYVMTVFSYGTGVPGGVFIPMLTMGTILGVGFGMVIQQQLPGFEVDPIIFAVAGMAAMFAATVRAPLTGLILAIEVTGSFTLMLPLIITTIGASVVTAQLGNQPIYSVLLQRILRQRKSTGEKISQ